MVFLLLAAIQYQRGIIAGSNLAQPLWIVLIGYALAKAFEIHDEAIFWMTDELVSGHTLKHLCAALGALPLALYVQKQSEISDSCG